MYSTATHPPLISVCILTYNHQNFIAQCLDSVLAQKVDGVLEICISDDASTDSNQQIITRYQQQHPDIIRANLNKINVGVFENRNHAMLACKGKYIAIIEGDDFWIDEYKLSKQLKIMEADPTLAFCFTDSYTFYEDAPDAKTRMCGNFPLNQDYVFDLEEYLINGYNIPTLTKMLRKDAHPKEGLPLWCKTVVKLDWVTHQLNLRYGKAYYLNQITAAYRRHSGGLLVSKGVEKTIQSSVFALQHLPAHFDKQYKKYFEQNTGSNMAVLLQFYFANRNYKKFIPYALLFLLSFNKGTFLYKTKALASIFKSAFKAKSQI